MEQEAIIKVYGNIEGTGGDFSYYELGDPLMTPDGQLNENVPVEKIREYVYFMETGMSRLLLSAKE